MKKLVIYRIGSLGDTVAALPSFVSIREAHSDYDITLLCNDDKKGSLRFYNQLVLTTGLVNNIVSYRNSTQNIVRLFSFLWALLRIRLKGCKNFYYLMPSQRSLASERRDNFILKLIGFTPIIGIRKSADLEEYSKDSEVKHLLRRTHLSADLSRESVFRALTHSVTKSDQHIVKQKINAATIASKRLYGLAPGGAKANHIWPANNFLTLAIELKRKYGATPIIFGGPAESSFFEKISAKMENIQFINHTYSIQTQLLIMERCDFFIGNDSGSIHLANLAGSPAIGIYPHPTKGQPWLPAWGNSEILRKKTNCQECPDSHCLSNNPCINLISVEDVIAAVEKVGNLK